MCSSPAVLSASTKLLPRQDVSLPLLCSSQLAEIDSSGTAVRPAKEIHSEVTKTISPCHFFIPKHLAL